MASLYIQAIVKFSCSHGWFPSFEYFCSHFIWTNITGSIIWQNWVHVAIIIDFHDFVDFPLNTFIVIFFTALDFSCWKGFDNQLVHDNLEWQGFSSVLPTICHFHGQKSFLKNCWKPLHVWIQLPNPEAWYSHQCYQHQYHCSRIRCLVLFHLHEWCQLLLWAR